MHPAATSPPLHAAGGRPTSQNPTPTPTQTTPGHEDAERRNAPRKDAERALPGQADRLDNGARARPVDEPDRLMERNGE